MTEKLNEFGHIDQEESVYLEDNNFDHFYTSLEQTLREYVGDFGSESDHINLVKKSIHHNRDIETNSAEMQIFDIFVKKIKQIEFLKIKKMK